MFVFFRVKYDSSNSPHDCRCAHDIHYRCMYAPEVSSSTLIINLQHLEHMAYGYGKHMEPHILHLLSASFRPLVTGDVWLWLHILYRPLRKFLHVGTKHWFVLCMFNEVFKLRCRTIYLFLIPCHKTGLGSLIHASFSLRETERRSVTQPCFITVVKRYT